ncbi:hypothetical protein [Streptomyces puniciscabiei]|uniref:hypothetical protein n=1 Tax=Streptomyces puniciscabiei TaxID=164348 RepID=UPI003326305A
MAIFSSLMPAKRRDDGRNFTSRHDTSGHGHRHGHRDRHDDFTGHHHGDRHGHGHDHGHGGY